MLTSVTAQGSLITSLCCSSGNRPDNEYFCRLVQADLAQGLPVDTYTGNALTMTVNSMSFYKPIACMMH